jgi:hypothetical protein
MEHQAYGGDRGDQPTSKPRDRRLPLIAGPMIWYALAGLSILLALYILFVSECPNDVRRYGLTVFIGLWAPMFGIMGLRADLMELREDLMRQER